MNPVPVMQLVEIIRGLRTSQETCVYTQALAVEMDAAALFAVGARAGVPVACLLALTDTFDHSGARAWSSPAAPSTITRSGVRSPRRTRSSSSPRRLNPR